MRLTIPFAEGCFENRPKECIFKNVRTAYSVKHDSMKFFYFCLLYNASQLRTIIALSSEYTEKKTAQQNRK